MAAELQGHAAYGCLVVEPRDAAGLCKAKLSIAVTPGCAHNRLTKVAPEVIFIDVGVPKKQGRVNVELLGFIAFLLDLDEDQVTLEAGADKKGKVVALSGLKQDKRQLIWTLERKVGERHEPHFAADNINAARNLNNKQAMKRRAELDEFQNLREEALSAPSNPLTNVLLGPPPAKKQMSALLVKRGATQGGDGGASDASPGKGGAALGGEASAARSPEAAAPPDAEATGGEVPAAAGPGLGVLAAYSSDEEASEDEEDGPRLPPPQL